MDEEQATMVTMDVSSLADGAQRENVPAGYKRTVAGVIPEDWTLGRLGDFGVFRSGSGFPLIYQGLQSGDYPFFKVSDMNNQGNELFMEIAIHWISEEVRKKLNAIKHPVGSIVFAKIGAAIFLERKRLLSRESCIDNNMIAFSLADRGACQQFFLYIFLRLELGKFVSTTALPSLSGRQIGAISVPIPASDEQRAIAEALSEVDELLGALDALITKKRTIKQATMQQLLTGKTRLPVFRGEWETKLLGEIVSVRNEKISPSCVDPDTICIELENIISGDGRLIKYSNASFSTSIKYRFYSGDILFGRLRPYLRKFWHADRDGICTTEIWPFMINLEQLENDFLYFIVQTNKFIEAAGVSYGTHMPRADWSVVQSFEIRLPPITEQRAIATILFDIDAEVASLERRRDKTRTLKHGMMQQLLTGKIRLVESVEATTRQVSIASAEKRHNWQFNEAVVISVLARRFGNENYPLSRMRYTKLSYLLHRHAEGRAEGYLKKAAGPYNPRTRYRGPETIALKNGYVRRHENGDYGGFIAGENIEKAESYFTKWYEEDCLNWLDQFRYEKRDDLELLTTVDLAVEELREAGKTISVEGVRKVIHSDPEWKAKLNRSIFSNTILPG